MTDYEILYEVLSDCFWTGIDCVPLDPSSDTSAQAAITIPAKVTELLDRLGFVMEDGMLAGEEASG